MNFLVYKNYIGTVEWSKEDKVLYGRILNIKGLILYEGNTIIDLIADMQSAIDDYEAVDRHKHQSDLDALIDDLMHDPEFCKEYMMLKEQLSN